MNLNTVFIVFRKEVLDIMRDKRTVIFMVLLPLLLMPGIFYLMSSFTRSSEEGLASQDSKIAVIGAEDAPLLMEYLRNADRQKAAPDQEELKSPLAVEQMSGANAFLDISEIDSIEEAHAKIKSEELNALLVIPAGFENDLHAKMTAEYNADKKSPYNTGMSLRIDFLSTNDFSRKAASRLRNSLSIYRSTFLMNSQDLATTGERMGDILGRLLPYIIILITFAGATFPAIALAAGEKEQKTLETLLASPAGRVELVTGKFLTIVMSSLISATLSVFGLYYSFTQMSFGGGLEGLTLHLNTTSIVLALLLIVPLALIFAAALLTLSVFAKSYREAQSYIAPLNMLVILPAFASFLPGVKLNYGLAMVPILNVSLVLKEILTGKVMEILPYYGVALGSCVAVAVIAIFVCAGMFKRESAIFKI